MIRLNPGKLYAPEGYWLLADEKRKEIVNGCGPRGLLGYLVPDKIHGLCITEPCNIHDYMYTVGGGRPEFEKANNVFMSNMMRLIDGDFECQPLNDTAVQEAMIRISMARDYYKAVCICGSKWFNWHENTNKTMGRL